MIQNPILPGFHPDPSICKVGGEFFLATSTFEWFPGVMIYQSTDLENWRLVARPLDRTSLLDLRGEEASCGVWAPCLTHDGNRFHLVYSDAKGKFPHSWDVDNYLITAEDISGPWSERVLLNHCGFDPSLFHDSDGRKWLTTLSQDQRPGRNRFGGIELQEYDQEKKCLVGDARIIYYGTELGCTEGPHLYRHNGFYYLMLAEGGTGWGHAVTVARSKTLTGPYEVDPNFPLLTSRDQPNSPLQKAGHGCLVEAVPGEWALVHLCSRPLPGTKRCPLGRETAIQRVYWNDQGWLAMETGSSQPQTEVRPFSLSQGSVATSEHSPEFNSPELPAELQTLREPFHESWGSLSQRPGWLRMYGRRSLYCNFDQSLVGRRIQHFVFDAETLIDYSPAHHQQSAGLVAFYDDNSFYALRVTFEPEAGRVLRLTCSLEHDESFPAADIRLPDVGCIKLRASMNYSSLRFSWATDGTAWQDIGVDLDASVLSDDFGPRFRFTGGFICLQAEDRRVEKIPADFRYLRYTPA